MDHIRANHTHWSEMIAILRIEGRISLQPSVALRDDDFFVWVRWQRLYLVIIRGYVEVRRWVTRTGKRGRPRTLSPGRAISLLTSSLPCSCGDLFTHAAWHGQSLASSTRMYGRRAHRISTRVLGEGRTSRIMKKKKKSYLNATTSPRSYVHFITMDQRLKSATSRGRDKSGFSVGYAGKGFSAN